MSTIRTFSDYTINLERPKQETIELYDIAHALSHIVRFNGHAPYPYTVAHHSIIMSYCIEPNYALLALLHDAAEAYLGDVTKPLKQIIGPAYPRLEKKWEKAIYKKYNVKITDLALNILKAADMEMLRKEQLMLFKDEYSERDLSSYFPQVPFEVRRKLEKYDLHFTTVAFLERFTELQRTASI